MQQTLNASTAPTLTMIRGGATSRPGGAERSRFTLVADAPLLSSLELEPYPELVADIKCLMECFDSAMCLARNRCNAVEMAEVLPRLVEAQAEIAALVDDAQNALGEVEPPLQMVRLAG